MFRTMVLTVVVAALLAAPGALAASVSLTRDGSDINYVVSGLEPGSAYEASLLGRSSADDPFPVCIGHNAQVVRPDGSVRFSFDLGMYGKVGKDAHVVTAGLRLPSTTCGSEFIAGSEASMNLDLPTTTLGAVDFRQAWQDGNLGTVIQAVKAQKLALRLGH